MITRDPIVRKMEPAAYRKSPDVGPQCPSCGREPPELLPAGPLRLLALCRCGTWTLFERHVDAPTLIIVERRHPEMRR